MAEVWRPTGDGKLEYVPTQDGAFEAWLDKEDPNWHYANSVGVEFMRLLWDAAVQHGKAAGDE
jgi:hypothetical protein